MNDTIYLIELKRILRVTRIN